jgi:hypothetical protein
MKEEKYVISEMYLRVYYTVVLSEWITILPYYQNEI